MIELSEDLHEQFARYFAWAYGGEEYAESGQSGEHWKDVTDDFLSRPFMRATVAAAEERGRAEVLAKIAHLIETAPTMRYSNFYPVSAVPVSLLLQLSSLPAPAAGPAPEDPR